MAIVFVPEYIKVDARAYNISNTLVSLVHNCEQLPLGEALNYFEVRFPYQYKRMSNFRLVAKLENVNEYDVIYLLDFLKRGSGEWKAFNDDPKNYGQKYLEPLINRENLETFITEKIEELSEQDKPKPKVPLPQHLAQWWMPFEHLPTDNLVMESEDWIRSFETKHYLNFWQSYYELVKAIVIDSSGYQRGFVCNDSRIEWVSDGRDHYVYFIEFGAADLEIGFVTVTYLISAVDLKIHHGRKDVFENELLAKYVWLDQDHNDILDSTDEIARYAKRGYPAFMLQDAPIWREIQESTEANLALSGEETHLLGKLRHATSGVLPVFINGRAGSGKSTLLYYLFSDYLFRKIKDKPEGELLFLTYSEPLLNVAKRNVRKLLEARPDILLERATSSILLEQDFSHFAGYFQPFIPFLLEISQRYAADQFTSDKYIDYKLFVQLFYGNNLPAEMESYILLLPQKGLYPEKCWHVIRTFIKGYHANSFLSPEEYGEIPNKEKSVSQQTYRQVYETIWDKWYKPLHEIHGFWDSQDLVRKIIQEKWAEPIYTVIFCDEAQDFTRVEIDLILHLLAYRQFDLGWDKRARLPFALAGDPFQTLNPTGFRWEAIKASFFDEISQNLDPFNRGTIEIQYEELFYNYRSEAPIVRFSNLLQLWRKLLFSTPEVEPQKPWREDQYIIPPRLFIIGETLSEPQFYELIKNSVVIVPCDQNEEEEFIAADPLLQRANSSNNLFSVQSPILAKGQEFPQVILYRFGEFCPDQFFDQSQNEGRLSHEYFLNKLYVGVTRAAKSLIIIDTQEGKEKLWEKAISPHEIELFLSRARDVQKWRELTDGVTSGSFIPAEFEKQDPIHLADDLRRVGKENESSALLRQAMDFYRRSGKEALAKICQAEALEMDKKYKEAAELFDKIGQGLDAERCYWKGKLWMELTLWFGSGGTGDELHNRIALLMVKPREIEPALEFLSFLLKAFKDGRKFMLSENQLQEGVKEAIQRLLTSDDEQLAEYWITLADLLVYLEPLFRIIGLDNVGQIYFLAQRFSEAVIWWEKAGKTNTSQYFQAKARTCSTTSERIFWLDKAGDPKLVVMEYEAHQESVPEREQKIVAQAYEQLGQLDKAVELYWKLDEYSTSVRLVKDMFKKNGESLGDVEADAREKYEILVGDGRLDIALDLFKALVRFTNRREAVQLACQYIEGLMRAGQWENAIGYTLFDHTRIDEKDLKRSTFPKIGRPSASELGLLQSTIVREFSLNPPETTVRQRQALTSYFLEIADRGYDNWSKYISIRELGFAIERTGRLIDILPFYEGLEKNNLSPLDRKFVQIRWLKTKSKQIERSRSEELSRKAIDKYDKDFEAKLKECSISRRDVEQATEYPNLELDGNDFITKPMLNVYWLPPRCRISDQKGNDLTLDVSTGHVMPFGIECSQSSQEQAIKFSIGTWGLEGEINIGHHLEFTLSGKKFEYWLNE